MKDRIFSIRQTEGFDRDNPSKRDISGSAELQGKRLDTRCLRGVRPHGVFLCTCSDDALTMVPFMYHRPFLKIVSWRPGTTLSMFLLKNDVNYTSNNIQSLLVAKKVPCSHKITHSFYLIIFIKLLPLFVLCLFIAFV